MATSVEIQRRHDALRSAMSEAGLEALVVCGRPFANGRIRYLTNLRQWGGGRAFLVFPADSEANPTLAFEPVFSTGPAAARAAGWTGSAKNSDQLPLEVVNSLEDLHVRPEQVAFAGLDDDMSVSHFRELESRLSTRALVDQTMLLDQIRLIKSSEEIEGLREASAIMNATFAAMERALKPGVRETDVTAEGYRVAQTLGCQRGYVEIARPPHRNYGPATDAIIQDSDVVAIEQEWAGPSGYWAEAARSYSFRPLSKTDRKFWDMLQEGFERCVATVRPGVATQDLINAVNEIYKPYGYAVSESVYLAHGIGLEPSEIPFVPGFGVTLESGVAICLHPQTRLNSDDERASLGHCMIVDQLIVTEQGCERLMNGAPWLNLE